MKKHQSSFVLCPTFRNFAAMKAPPAVLLTILLLLTACYGDRRQQMLGILDEADSLNRNYIPFATDSQLLAATRFFDAHGTSLEQLRAHYLLGCAYRDLGQAPEALQAWHDAIDRADTTSRDSVPNALLCRVYSQMADVFYQQNLIDYQLEFIDKSVSRAFLCRDSLTALNQLILKMGAYSKLNLPDSMVKVYLHSCFLADNIGDIKLISQNSMIMVPAFLTTGNIDMASKCISLYEKYSGYVDSLGFVNKGREVYYYLKGLYLLQVGNRDSAEMYFRRELSLANDFNNQNGASCGLAQLYEKAGISDSVAKYMKYAYEQNDSVYSHLSTFEVAKIRRLYNYSLHQRRSQDAMTKVHREHERVSQLTSLLLGTVIVTIILVSHWRRKRRIAKAQYEQVLSRLNETQQAWLQLRSDDINLQKLIAEKENRVQSLSKEIEALRNTHRQNNALSLETSPLYALLRKKSIRGQAITNDEWDALNKLAIDFMPSFCQRISDSRYGLTLREYQLCVLLRIHFKPAEISRLLDLNISIVTRMGKSALHKLFNANGVNKDLIRLLLTL